MIRLTHALCCVWFCIACQSPERRPAAPASAPRTSGTSASARALASASEPLAARPIDRALPRPAVIAKPAPLPGFMRGINLGNCLDAPHEGAWGTVLTEQHFSMAAAAGFDHVRLPVRFSAPERAQRSAPFTIDEQFFQRVDWALDRARAHQLSVVLDLHHYEEMNQEPLQHRERLYALWNQIAARYSNRPASVAFEILNEPFGALEPKLLNEITREALRIIRKTNPTRLVFASPYRWSHAEHLTDLQLPADDAQVVADFHMYDPHLFTHQGANWMAASFQSRQVLFPGPPPEPLVPVAAAQSESWVARWFDDYNRLPIAQNPSGPSVIFQNFERAARYVKATSKRVYLGEFGALNTADEQSRENYLWLVRTEAERHGIGWAYWNDGEFFKVMDPETGQFNQRLLRALLDR